MSKHKPIPPSPAPPPAAPPPDPVRAGDTVECPMCDGRGYIGRFAAAYVCTGCKGSRTTVVQEG